jgi:hypothetical protein
MKKDRPRRPRRDPADIERRVARNTQQVRSCKPVALNQLRPGVLVMARVPFADGDGDKVRPAVVRAATGRSVTVHPCYTRARHLTLRSERRGRVHHIAVATVEIDRIAVLSVCAEQVDPEILAALGIVG